MEKNPQKHHTIIKERQLLSSKKETISASAKQSILSEHLGLNGL